jgi:putative transposase
MQNELVKEAAGKKVMRPSFRREMAQQAVAVRGVSIALACRAFAISQRCYRYAPLLADEN